MLNQTTFPPGSNAPGNAPVQGRTKALRPKDARPIIESRKLPDQIYDPKSQPKIAAFGPPPSTPSITALAEALEHNVDKIHLHVKNNIRFLPTFGSQKGALSCLVDGQGNAFDQAALMVALLRASGYTANFLYGELRLTSVEAGSWLGSDQANIWSSRNLLANGGIPADVIWDPNLLEYFLELSHVWVKVDITGSGNWYVFDPSFKQHTATGGIDLQSAMGYNATTFQNACLSGSTVTADYVKDINTVAMQAQLQTMADNLNNWIATNDPDATMDDLVGSRTLVEVTGEIRDTTLPHQNPDVTPTEWTDIPNTYKATLSVMYDTINQSFFSQDIAGKRLTLFFNGSLQAELRLDGVLLATSSAQLPGSWNSVLLSITHPYGYQWADQSFWQRIWAGKYYVIGNSWGNSSPEMAYLHQKALADNITAGGADTAENVLGESLLVLWHNWSAEKSIACDLIGRLNNCSSVLHHQVGLTGHFDTPFLDLGGIVWSSSANDNDYAKVPATDTVIALRGIGFESNAIDQVPNIAGVSTNTVLNVANSAGQKIYIADSSNWSSQVRPNLVNYDSQVLNDIETWYINAGWKVMIHENGSTSQNSYHGYGFYGMIPTGGAVGIINGFLLGGTGSMVQAPAATNLQSKVNQGSDDKLDKVEIDYKVDSFTGNFSYQHTDLSVGSKEFPWGLHFTRYYSSKDRNTINNMGRGWRHNYMISAEPGNDAYAALGKYAGGTTSSNLVQLKVAVLQANGSFTNTLGFVLASLSTDFASKKLTSNIVTVKDGPSTYVFTQLSDNNYAPPKGASLGLAKVNGQYVMQSFDGVVWNFRQVDGKIETIVYPTGVTLTFTYSGAFTDFHLESVSNNLGRTLTFEYDTVSVLSYMKKVNAGSRFAQFAINFGNGNLETATNAAGGQIVYTYDTKYRMQKYRMPNFAEIVNTYDDQDRVISQQNPKNTTTFTYTGQVTRAFTAAGGLGGLPGVRVLVTVFNSDGKPLSIYNGQPLPGPVGGNAASVKFWYDGLGREVQRSYTDGDTILMVYDDYNRMISRTRLPKDQSLSPTTEGFGYNGTANRWTVYTNPRGQVTTRTYSGANLTGETGPQVGGQSPVKTWTYVGNGLVDVYTDPTGIRTKHSYIGENLTQVIHDEGAGRLNLTTNYGYDGYGNRTSQTDPRGNTTTFEFDLLRRMTKQIAPAPFLFETKFTYDVMGNLTKTERQTNGTPAWQVEERTYSSTNRLLTVKDALNNVTTNTYGAVDQLWKVTDAENRTTEYQHDSGLRLIKTIDANGVNADERTYDQNDKLLTIKDARNNVSTYLYDALNRKKRLTYPDTSYEEWSYDQNANVTNFRTRSGDSISYTYDNLDRQVTRGPAGQATVTMTYDLAGRLLTASTPVVSGNPATGTFSRGYDTAGRLISETNPQNQVFSYQRDANGNVTRITYPGGYFVDQVFDQLNRLTNIKLNGSASSAATFSYDALSRRTQLSYLSGAVTTYGYDLGNNRTSMGINYVGSSASWTYGFNKVHQMTSQAFSDIGYQWRPAAAGNTAYGTADNVNKYPTVGGTTQTYNTDGCLTGDGTWTYGYNTENMLVSAVKTGVTMSFDYDPFLRQIRKTSGSTQRRYVYSGDQLLAEYNNANGALVMRYVYADGIDDPIAQIAPNGTVTYLHQDHAGSIIARSSAAGAVLTKYKYGPFGDTPSLANVIFGFTGQRFDAESGLYHFKRRYYNPVTGRFLQPDSIGYSAGLHLYRYGKNDPMNHRDPSGTIEEELPETDPRFGQIQSARVEIIPHLINHMAMLEFAGGFAIPALMTAIGGVIYRKAATSGSKEAASYSIKEAEAAGLQSAEAVHGTAVAKKVWMNVVNEDGIKLGRRETDLLYPNKGIEVKFSNSEFKWSNKHQKQVDKDAAINQQIPGYKEWHLKQGPNGKGAQKNYTDSLDNGNIPYKIFPPEGP